MTVTEKKELIQFLKRGDKKLICQMAGVHETVMYGWIRGRLKTSSIEPYVIKLSNQRKKEFEAQTEVLETEKVGEDFEEVNSENRELKEALKSSNQAVRKYQRLISGENRIYGHLFEKLLEFVSEAAIPPYQKSAMFDQLHKFRSDFSFLRRSEHYTEILTAINPLFSKTLKTMSLDLEEYQQKILSLIKLNLSVHEIAVILAVSDRAIEKERKILVDKFKLKSENELTDYVNLL